MSDLVQIKPEDFKRESMSAIEYWINQKYANKVVQKIGLCICLYDVLWTSEGLIGHGTGLVNVNAEFRLIVFRPFKGEVMFARVKSATPSGIYLRTEFFNDIFVPWEELPIGAEYSHSEQLWVWYFGDEEYFYDVNEKVRFQVVEEEWQDLTPEGPSQSEETTKTAYKIKGSMSKEGLGCCLWWD